ncbi:MAG TPA: acyltransferase [Solirubrobacteraceae bacterium]|nr:acyltransferase [Solirubrobacteraceae bacterium]
MKERTSGLRLELVKYAARLRLHLVSAVQAQPFWPNAARLGLLRRWGMQIAPGTEIGPSCHFSGPGVILGECFLNREVHLDASGAATITIAEGCEIGPGTMLMTSHHEIGPAPRRAGTPGPRSIVIERGSWLGARVLVLPGVTVGAGCVIAAGAVVNRDCEPNGLYAGVPARRIRNLEV